MKCLVIADSMINIRPAFDSTLALVRSLRARRHHVYWATPSQLFLENNRLGVTAAECASAEKKEKPMLGPETPFRLKDFQAVLIRKDPPFDSEYTKLCWLLQLEEPNVYMMNLPSILLRFHEKMIPLLAWKAGYLEEKDVIATFLGNENATRNFFVKKPGTVIQKPFFGFGGKEIQKLSAEEFSRLTNFSQDLIQPFENRVVREGDIRVLYAKGKVIGQFARIPKANGFVSNLAQGGTAKFLPLSKKQETVTKRLGKFLVKTKIDFAGADLIGEKISEVNITSPTGLVNYEELTGKEIAGKLVELIERSVASRKR